jgi:hypothetical protein
MLIPFSFHGFCREAWRLGSLEAIQQAAWIDVKQEG